jgi:threonine dehydratase
MCRFIYYDGLFVIVGGGGIIQSVPSYCEGMGRKKLTITVKVFLLLLLVTQAKSGKLMMMM